MNCVIACSPRLNGNSDMAAKLVLKALQEGITTTGQPCGQNQIWRVADQRIHPCISCGYCSSHPGRCSLDINQDQAMALLQNISQAQCACMVSPIYFYHLPAQAKALLDRAQAFWTVAPEQKPGRGQRLGVVFICAREQGEQLTRGAMLSLRYMAEALGIRVAEPLVLHGLDEAHALLSRPDLHKSVHLYARSLLRQT